MGAAPFGLTTGPGIDIEEDDVSVVLEVETLNFEGNVTVVDEGSSKVTVTILDDDDDIDGGFANTVYLISQSIDGMGA